MLSVANRVLAYIVSLEDDNYYIINNKNINNLLLMVAINALLLSINYSIIGSYYILILIIR